MKDKDYDFDGAKTAFDNWQSNYDAFELLETFEDEFKFALALAKEIQAGTVTDEMDAQGHYDAMLAKSHIEVYKAMTQELMKKVKEDLG